MKPHIGVIWATLAAAILFGGCSGSGTGTATVEGESVKTLAAAHLSSVMLLRSWDRILYVRVPATQHPDVHYESLPGGGTHYWGTQTDGATFDWTLEADGSGSGTQTETDGDEMSQTWSVPTTSGTVTSWQISESHSSGSQMTWTYELDSGLPTYPQTWTGTATTADARTMNFVLHRTLSGEDSLSLELPGGMQMTMRTPVTAVAGATYWPRFTEGATGTVRTPGAPEMTYKLTGANDVWTRWELTAADGSQGSFTLGQEMAGQGQLAKGSELLAALSWNASIDGSLQIVASGAEEVHPSAAAQAFQVDRWVRNIAALGPAPIY